MSDRTPHDPRADVPEEELAALLRRGRPSLAEVSDDRLSGIWRAIDDELDLEAATVRTAIDGPAARPGGSVSPVADDEVTSPTPVGARRRWAAFVPTAVAAAVALVVGVGAGFALAPEPEAPAATSLATWTLEPVEDAAVDEVGAVLREEDGVRTVELALGELPGGDGFHEVWLLDPATGALTSLGPVRPDGRYVVPDGTDLRALTALDVSAEPLDGDPGHSGNSLLRGEVVWSS